MSLRCLIIDDEPLAHDIILSYLKDVPFLENCGQCYRATDAFDFLSKNEIDLIFLDIRMPKLSGLDFIKTLKNKPIIIITSAYEEYALESFDLDVCDYLLKPFRFDRLLKAANRALEIHNLKSKPVLQKQENNPVQNLTIKTDKKLIVVDLNEIYFLESLGNYVKVWLENNFLLTQKTLTSFEEQLQSDQFVRVHKSFILNRKFLHFLEGHVIHLKNGTQLPVGKNYRTLVREMLG